MKRLLFLTGPPGIGKTTVLLKCVEALKALGYSVGGMLSREVRGCEGRVGFEVLDLSSSRRGWLAHVEQKTGPRIGRYRVNLVDLEGVGVKAIVDAVECLDVVAIDEVGPMELFSARFREAVMKAVDSQKLVVGVVHWKARDSLVDEVKNGACAEVHVVSVENRNELPAVIVGKAVEFLKTHAARA